MREVLKFGPYEQFLLGGDPNKGIYLRSISFHSGQLEVPAELHLFEATDATCEMIEQHIGFFNVPLDEIGGVLPSTVQIHHLYKNLVLRCPAEIEVSISYEEVQR